MSSILSRIEKLSKNEGITIGALERKIGASKGVLSRAIAKGTDIQSKWIQLLVENYPNYSSEWLLTGNGTMLIEPSDVESGDLIKKLREKDAQLASLSREIDKLRTKIETQSDFIELIINKITKNSGGGNLSGLPAIEAENPPIDLKNTYRDLIDMR